MCRSFSSYCSVFFQKLLLQVISMCFDLSSCKLYALPVYGPEILCKIEGCEHLFHIHYYCDSICCKVLQNSKEKLYIAFYRNPS